MCKINWSLVAEMLTGIGTFLIALAALIVLPKQLGYKRESKELKSSLKLMLPTYKNYMASEEGIVWGDYPNDADKIVECIARRTKLKQKIVREMLDELKAEGKI